MDQLLGRWSLGWRNGHFGSNDPESSPNCGSVRRENSTDIKDNDEDSHLRSTNNVTEYTIHAIDGKIGDVEDFSVDDSSWNLDYLVVDTGHWFSGKKVLISPKLVKEIDWDTSEVIIKVSEADVKNSPEYEPGETISESYVGNLQNYYGNSVDSFDR